MTSSKHPVSFSILLTSLFTIPKTSTSPGSSLASSATSIPEAGLDLATYFAPCDLPAFQDLLARWIEDDAEVVAAEARIAKYLATSTLVRWEDSAAAVLNFVRSGSVASDTSRVGWNGSITSGERQ
jgi:hypothetical protein